LRSCGIIFSVGGNHIHVNDSIDSGGNHIHVNDIKPLEIEWQKAKCGSSNNMTNPAETPGC
jgi:hypothetical protein